MMYLIHDQNVFLKPLLGAIRELPLQHIIIQDNDMLK